MHYFLTTRRSNVQKKNYLLFVFSILFDLYPISYLLFHLFLPIYVSILNTDMGGPKKCRNIYKLNKYKNKINTAKQFICLISYNRC